MNYIGVTPGTFKDIVNNHTKSLNNLAYSNETYGAFKIRVEP